MRYNGIYDFIGSGEGIALGVLHILYITHLPSPEHFENMVQGRFLVFKAIVLSCIEEQARIPFSL
jgi:hypothetical protein